MRLLALATVTADGRPLVGPVDGIFFRGAFHFGSAPDSARFRHIRARPQVSATHLPGEELAVTVHGRAVPIDIGDPAAAGFPPRAARHLRAALRRGVGVVPRLRRRLRADRGRADVHVLDAGGWVMAGRRCRCDPRRRARRGAGRRLPRRDGAAGACAWRAWDGCATARTARCRCTPRGRRRRSRSCWRSCASGPPSAHVAASRSSASEPRATSSSRCAASAPASSSCRSTRRARTTSTCGCEVDGVMRSWAVPRGPSLDPAAKRLAVEVADHDAEHNAFEGALGEGRVIVWDRGTYEQGGRVPWPEALSRGHAVFVLHGEKLRGGFALQRTGRGGEAPVAADQAPRRRRAARDRTSSPSSRDRS